MEQTQNSINQNIYDNLISSLEEIKMNDGKQVDVNDDSSDNEDPYGNEAFTRCIKFKKNPDRRRRIDLSKEQRQELINL